MAPSKFPFGQQVAALREQAGLSQKQLADKAGLARSAIARMETGVTIPDVATLDAVARALGIELNISLQAVEPGGAHPAQEVGPPKIKILIADSQQMTAEALAVALSQFADFEVHFLRPEAGPVATGLEAAEAATRLRPNVMLLDYWMAEMDGPAATRAILQWSPGVRVLLLSWIVSPLNVQEALNAGAAGFLPRSLGIQEVAEAIRKSFAGEPLVHGRELAKVLEVIGERQGEAEQFWERLKSLTPREVDVVRLLADGNSVKTTASRLDITTGTLRIHLQNIMSKTGAESRVEVIAIARKAGLIP